jgi:hypothetical protein
MNPGRELDALVAERVMGWNSMGDSWASGPSQSDRTHKKDSWKPSEDIAAAWEVVEKLPGFRLRKLNGAYWCTFANNWDDELIDATEETAPHAICVAALKALGHEQ